jgi:hypothetical protein
MNYEYKKITWTQLYTGWQEWQLQVLEKRLARSNLTEAKQVLARIMSL